jgi:hypothetical protein
LKTERTVGKPVASSQQQAARLRYGQCAGCDETLNRYH